MRKSGLWCVFFFVVAQSAIVIALKRFHSFAESKLFLITSETIVVIATALWYTLMQPSPKRRQRPEEPPAVRPMETVVQDNPVAEQ